MELALTNTGIKRTLNRLSIEDAICEFIWNGFDAHATKIDVVFSYSSPNGPGKSDFDVAETLAIMDNGEGINYNDLERKFRPFGESEKAMKKREDNVGIKGQNGYGRLSFFKFAKKAMWSTYYRDGADIFQYEIHILEPSLNSYQPTTPELSRESEGTMVFFTEISPDINSSYVDNKLIPFIRNEFSWYLKLNEGRGCSIIVDGEPITYEHLIGDSEKFDVNAVDEHGGGY